MAVCEEGPKFAEVHTQVLSWTIYLLAIQFNNIFPNPFLVKEFRLHNQEKQTDCHPAGANMFHTWLPKVAKQAPRLPRKGEER